ncbi:hypothetical protein [Vibrio rotiferianus]|uniref:Uncharacterized protein n=1 Tax=Vibrio rotiferianus TaxID=190895 RepID=A0A510IDW4_9VIBR|nr:hypothetical protein [Vibrio rotiferianus]BBL90606.1 hypothetical protein VroAM7_32590 [Vibrio rotiferianus]CAH1548754.1 conserved hypothetical protein [Vibrio rotiferianus]
MTSIIENNDLLIKQLPVLDTVSHENKSCDDFFISLSSAESLAVDAANINSLLISGAIDNENLVLSLQDQLQEKLDTLKCVVSCLQLAQSKPEFDASKLQN